jgi:hypothetical protein
VIESIGLAAAQFALEYAGGRWLDWRKRQRLASAYRESAEETIELCVCKGYPARSPVWESVTSLLGSEEKARQVALWYTQHRIRSKELQEMAKNDPIVVRFIKEFIVRLNDRRAVLLPLDLANLADIISERVALLLDEPKSEALQPTGRTTYWLGRPTSLTENFFGRKAELGALTTAFENCRVVVISGGAGTGKSRLAAEFSYRSQMQGFWTTAGATWVQTLTALMQSVGVFAGEATDEEIAVAVQKRLSELTPETLWVVDNLDDLSQVNELTTAAGPVSLIITTRDARRHLLPPNAAFLEVYPLNQDPAIALLCSRSKHDAGDASLSEIAQQAGGLPLALEMLAVRLGEPRQTPKRLLNELKNAPTTIELGAFQQVAGATIPRTKGVFTTIVGMLNRLPLEARQQLSPLESVVKLEENC